MKFEGLWSSETHPKDFPNALWLTHFSDIIGATHDKNYSFWAEGQWATDGVRQLAEWGSTAILESELRQQVPKRFICTSNEIISICKLIHDIRYCF